MGLSGKTVLVTGGGHRVGAAIVRAVAEAGAGVVVHYHRSADQARQLCEELQDKGVRCVAISADLTRAADRQHLLDRAQKELGAIWGLVCNAAVFQHTPFFSVTEQQWDQILSVNLKSTFFLCQQVGRMMVEQGEGRMVLITDVSADHPWPGYLPYTVSKAGVAHLVAGLAKALAPHVQVNGVAPGTVLPAAGASEKELEFYRESTLLKRIGRPQDVVRAVVFLLEQADFITGTILPVDGGYRLGGGG